MKLLVLTLMVLLGITEGAWCEKKYTFYTHFSTKADAYKDVQEAKTACDQDDSCGGVGLDKIPYREAHGAPPKYAHTIYLMGVDKVEKGSWMNYRYTSYVKC